MNRGLNFYGIILLTIATILVFSLADFGVVNATTGIDLDDNPAQSNQVPDLKSDPNDNEESTNNNNDDTNNNNNDDTNNDDTNNDQSSTRTPISTSNTNNDDTNNDQTSTSTPTSTSTSTPTSTSTSTPTSTSTSTTTTTTSNDNVPMSIPFNSNMADESDDETDYSSIIPFP